MDHVMRVAPAGLPVAGREIVYDFLRFVRGVHFPDSRWQRKRFCKRAL